MEVEGHGFFNELRVSGLGFRAKDLRFRVLRVLLRTLERGKVICRG